MGLVERLVGGTTGGCLFGRQGPVGKFGNCQTIGKLEAGLETVGKTRGHIRAHDGAVNHHVNVVFVLLVESRNVGDLVELAVHLDALEALLHQLGKFFLVLAFAAAHDRREDVKTRAFLESEDAVDHLADRLAFNRQARGRRIGTPTRAKRRRI